MPTYKSPLQPYDPVVHLPGTSTFQYLRDNFYGAGQDSYTGFPAQNQELFSSLKNLMPVTNGILQLRYGYQLFNNPGIGAIQRLYNYQNSLAGVRKLLLISGNAIDNCNEDGTSVASILTSSNVTNPRATVTRDYAYFPSVVTPFTWPSSAQSDGKKWNSTSGVTDWGLDRPSSAVNVTSVASAGNVTMVSTIGRVYAGAWQNSTTGHYSDINVGVGSFSSGVAGASFPTVDAQTSTGNIAWSSIGNINANDGVFATAVLPSGASTTTEFISGTGFGFAIPSTATIYGIQVTLSKKASVAATKFVTDQNISLLKAGVQVGTNKADTTSLWPTGITAFNYGGSSDLWGTTWTPADINAANFGVGLSATANGSVTSNVTASLDYFAITITYATGTGANTGAITSKQIALALPTNAPAGADKFNILATLDGGDTSTLYILATVPAGTATYTDNTPDSVLVTNNIYSELDDFGTIHGGQDNDFPPIGLQFPTKYRGRIFGSIKATLYFSKSLDEVTTSTGLVVGRFEEAWPGVNTLDVSTQYETIRGLLTDGDVLYIGTERHIWRLSGDSPANFSKPEVVFNEVGILNQDVWQIVFAEGRPLGMIWFTPDRRVIMSNFGNYEDIGTPIQDVLNTFNSAAGSAAWGGFFSEGAYDIYILAIPTGANTTPDTFCVLDLRSQRWLIWTPTDQFSSGLYNINASGTPQWLMGASTGKVYQFVSTAIQDRVNDTPVAISPSIQTPWMHLGSPTMVKSLNEIEVITGDANMTLTVDGASIFTQSISPRNVVTNSSLSNSPRGFKKLYLASNPSLDRFYRFTFNGTGSAQNVLEGFTIEAVPIPY